MTLSPLLSSSLAFSHPAGWSNSPVRTYAHAYSIMDSATHSELHMGSGSKASKDQTIACLLDEDPPWS